MILDIQNLHDDKDVVFNGKYSGFQRFDKPRYPMAVKLEELMRGNFWNPNEISVVHDRDLFTRESEKYQTVMKMIWFYQTLMDSAQNRGLGYTLSQIVTNPEYEALVKTWEYFELIHSMSYSHIIRGIYNDSNVFNSLLDNFDIANRVSEEVNLYTVMSKTKNPSDEEILQLLSTIFALEGIKFYVSFLMTYLIQDRTKALPGVTRIIKLINHDEDLHTQASLLMRQDSEILSRLDITEAKKIVRKTIETVYDNEIKFAKVLYSIEPNLPESFENIEKFIRYYCELRYSQFFKEPCSAEKTPLVEWFENEKNLNNSNVSIQESDLLVYNIGDIVDDF